MLKEHVGEVVTITAFIVVLILLLNPFGFWMPDALTYMMIAGVVIIFALFAGFVLKDSARDEREVAHKMVSGRIGYVAGVGVLVLAIALEGISQLRVDPWLIIALGSMVLARVLGAWYVESRS